jgi:hypothetical protein
MLYVAGFYLLAGLVILGIVGSLIFKAERKKKK